MKTGILFGVWPYVAILLFLGGLSLRCWLAGKRVGLLNLEFNRAKELFRGGRVWRLSLLLLLLGHLAGLLFPQQILLWNAVPLRLYGLEACFFAIGAVGLAGCCGLIWRHLGRSKGSVSRQVADSAFLSLLFAAVLSGLLMAVFYRWASSWGVLTLTPYVRSLFSGNPATALAAEMPFVTQIHVFSSLAALAALPFTRLAPLMVLPLRGALELFMKPATFLTQTARRMVESAVVKYNPALRIWPEEE